MNEWINVKDRLPTKEDTNKSEMIIAIYVEEGFPKPWYWNIVAKYPSVFSHWMPLPEPPKEDK